jgi:hypothetical protein
MEEKPSLEVGWLVSMDNADDAGLFLHNLVIEETSRSARAIVDHFPSS